MIETLNDEGTIPNELVNTYDVFNLNLDETLIHAHVETVFTRSTTIDDDEISIALGECQPSEVVNSPAGKTLIKTNGQE